VAQGDGVPARYEYVEPSPDKLLIELQKRITDIGIYPRFSANSTTLSL